jgi:hypothetical protein
VEFKKESILSSLVNLLSFSGTSAEFFSTQKSKISVAKGREENRPTSFKVALIIEKTDKSYTIARGL